jgi:hypothetical protein
MASIVRFIGSMFLPGFRVFTRPCLQELYQRGERTEERLRDLDTNFAQVYDDHKPGLLATTPMYNRSATVV